MIKARYQRAYWEASREIQQVDFAITARNSNAFHSDFSPWLQENQILGSVLFPGRGTLGHTQMCAKHNEG